MVGRQRGYRCFLGATHQLVKGLVSQFLYGNGMAAGFFHWIHVLNHDAFIMCWEFV